MKQFDRFEATLLGIIVVLLSILVFVRFNNIRERNEDQKAITADQQEVANVPITVEPINLGEPINAPTNVGETKPEPKPVQEARENTSQENMTRYFLSPRIVQVHTDNQLPELKQNAKLQMAAQAKANDMLAKQYFAHTAPGGKDYADFALATGISIDEAGEVLSLGYLDRIGNVDIDTLVRAWLDSPSHKEVMTNPKYTIFGIGVAYGEFGGKQTAFISVIYAKPR